MKWHNGKSFFFLRRGDSHFQHLTTTHSRFEKSCNFPSWPQARCANSTVLGYHHVAEEQALNSLKAPPPQTWTCVRGRADKYESAVVQYNHAANVLQPNPLRDLKMKPDREEIPECVLLFFHGLKCSRDRGFWPSVNGAFHSLNSFPRTEAYPS